VWEAGGGGGGRVAWFFVKAARSGGDRGLIFVPAAGSEADERGDLVLAHHQARRRGNIAAAAQLPCINGAVKGGGERGRGARASNSPRPAPILRPPAPDGACAWPASASIGLAS